MPRRWVWSLLDIAGLIFLGQATILAQRQASGPPPRLDAAVELSRAEKGAARQAARIFEAGGSVVVALKLPEGAPPPPVTVEDGAIRLPSADGGVDEVPVPSAADPRRYTVRAAAGEVRVIFEKAVPEED